MTNGYTGIPVYLDGETLMSLSWDCGGPGSGIDITFSCRGLSCHIGPGIRLYLGAVADSIGFPSVAGIEDPQFLESQQPTKTEPTERNQNKSCLRFLHLHVFFPPAR